MIKTFSQLVNYITKDLLEGKGGSFTVIFHKDAIVFKFLCGSTPAMITYYPAVAVLDKSIIVELADSICEHFGDFKQIYEVASTIIDYRSVIDKEFFEEVEVYENDN